MVHFRTAHGRFHAFVLVVCTSVASATLAADIISERELDPKAVDRGEVLFEQHCQRCHGVRASGPAGDWRQRDASGKLPPPPLDGTAHTWHHSNSQLIEIIENGSLAYGGNMPAWKTVLQRTEIESILAWIKSLWPEQAYAIWLSQWKER